MQLDATTMEGMTVERTSITDLSVIGEELTDDDLRRVAGGEKVLDFKSYDDGVYVDHEIYIIPD